MWLRVLLSLILLILGAGCAPGSATRGEGPATAAAPSPSPVSEPPPAPPPPPAEIRLAFVGDILLGGSLAETIRQRGENHPWVHAAPMLREADLSLGNLETAVTLGGTPAPDKQFTFRSRPDTLQGPSQAGLDILSLGNNHSLDYGREALVETIRHVAEAGIYPVGAGRTAAEAAQPVFVELRGLKVAVLAFSRVIPEVGWVAGTDHPGVNPGWDPGPTVAAVREARSRADLVVVLLHWGEELKEQPRPDDTQLAQQLIEAGAAVVAGHHPHILQGMQLKDRSLVAYSLGNFVFTAGSNPVTSETGVLEVTLDRSGVKSARFTPMIIREGQPRPAGKEGARRILQRLDQLSRRWQTSISADGEIRAHP